MLHTSSESKRGLARTSCPGVLSRSGEMNRCCSRRGYHPVDRVQPTTVPDGVVLHPVVVSECGRGCGVLKESAYSVQDGRSGIRGPRRVVAVAWRSWSVVVPGALLHPVVEGVIEIATCGEAPRRGAALVRAALAQQGRAGHRVPYRAHGVSPVDGCGLQCRVRRCHSGAWSPPGARARRRAARRYRCSRARSMNTGPSAVRSKQKRRGSAV